MFLEPQHGTLRTARALFLKELDDNFDQITEEFQNKDTNGLLVA
jgi:hypothetical protein